MIVDAIQFQSPRLLWGLLLVPLVAVAALALEQRRRGRVQWTCLGVRVLALALAVCMLSGMRLVTRQAPGELLVLVDRSASMRRAEGTVKELERQALREASGYAAAQVIYFGADTAVDAENVHAEATRLDRALEAAVGQVPDLRKGHVLVLSDGVETAGDALLSAGRIMDRGGVRMDTLWVDTRVAEPEVEITAVSAPLSIALGQSCELQVTCRANQALNAAVRLLEANTVLAQKRVTVAPGEHTYTFKVSPVTSGTHVYQATVTADQQQDTISANNARAVCLQVVSGSKILLLEGQTGHGEPVASLLRSAGHEVDILPTSRMPTSLTRLGEYAMILLDNVDAQYLNTPQQKLLNDMVYQYGRSVLAAGGAQTFAYGHMKDTTVEKLLPVRMDVGGSDERQSIALVLLVDNSASMGEAQTRIAGSSDSAMNQAKRGAILCLEALRESDRLSIICFSDHTEIVYPMASIQEKDAFLTAISRMGTLDGTNFTAGLEAALQAFDGYESYGLKQVVLISDGNPSDEGYEEVVRSMRDRGIILSTIGVGNAVNKPVMQRLAELGGGQFSFTTMGQSLETLMVASADLLQSDFMHYGISALSWLDGTAAALPSVEAYNRVTARDAAQVLISSEHGDPVYVRWQYGRGNAAVLAVELDGDGTGAWLEDSRGQGALLRIVDELMPASAGENAVDIALENTGEECLLRVRTRESVSAVSARLTAGKEAAEAELIQVAAGRFEALLLLTGVEPYRAELTITDGASDSAQRVETYVAAGYAREYEAFPEQNGEALLASLAELGGGQALTSPEVSAEMLREVPLTVDLTPFLAALALVLLLVELMLRRRKSR